MKIIIDGLGRMGGQIAEKLLADGHEVVAHNRSPEPVKVMADKGAIAAYSKEEAVAAFAGEPILVWVMIPANVIDTAIDEWLALAPEGSNIIDGGNSDYRGDSARAERVSAKGCNLLDIGTSGGVHGFKRGFCMMVGGNRSIYEYVSPLLDTLAAPSGAHSHFGPNGAGHYVKMVHNAIEYGMMQSLAEGYRMLREGPIADIDLARAGEVWQHSSVITSWLNELSAEALSESPTLDGIDGVVAESGEARWTLETAADLGIPLPAIQASFDVRLASQAGDVNFATKLLAAQRNKFGGHDINGKQ
ncbi:NADP-dependent phosphogluconate dehydrogenase [Candidatus Mycosynbacter amalyticus]|uniref:NADP-dependent phosphogluconate dehydrogenase n=1 Tax=Candidatus Mycosynbacter amalyticus TaxID=2665156 RepID=A0A857MPL6_9BACT|nr:NADP-dependent phosphogluconate dehydrogenase [Candidatus Mycosynbacter amalyticus]QHN43031.1 NADP-dependent phosphogluconate dehydrogenase [Candidatus Mycosynbacter amalyticus]